jgi:hypothetical protein
MTKIFGWVKNRQSKKIFLSIAAVLKRKAVTTVQKYKPVYSP